MSHHSSHTDMQAAETGEQWRRLSPVAIVYFTASNIKKLVSGAIYAIPALAYSYSVTDLSEHPLLWPVIIAVLGAMAGSGIVSYFFYQFRVHGQHAEVKSGVLQRSHVNLPFSRIQNVKIEQPIYYRPHDFALVTLDTAGSSKDEAKIVAIPMQFARALRRAVMAKETDSVDAQQYTHESPDNSEVVLNTRTIADLIIHGITNNRVWIILGAMAPFYESVSGPVYDMLGRWLPSLPEQIEAQTLVWWQFAFYALILLAIIMALVALLSVAGAVITFYGYTLSRDADRYVRRSGLFTRQEVSMHQTRIQLVAAKQDWLDVLLKRINFYFEQNTSRAQQNESLMSPNKLLVPSVTPAEAKNLVQDIMPGNRVFSVAFTPVSSQFVWHWCGIRLLPVFGLLSLIALFNNNYSAAGVCTLVYLFVCGLVWLRWYRWGVAVDEQFIYVKSGLLGRDVRTFERYKLQQAEILYTPLMVRKNLRTVRFVLASGAITVPFLPVEYASHIVNDSLYITEKSQRSWM